MKEIYTRIGNHELRLSNLNKVFWPEKGYTKSDLLSYYVEVAPFILPHLKNRPFVMNRYPDGITGKSFYQKQCPDFAPEWIPKWTYQHSESKKTYCVVKKIEDLIWLINLGCIETNVWLSSTDKPENPDFVVWDLDPGPGVDFSYVVEVALKLYKMFNSQEMSVFPKLSGGKGIHIYLPIILKYKFEDTRQFSYLISRVLEQEYPHKITTNRDPRARKGKIYLDYLQNGLGKTMASVFSVRPLPGAPISIPVSWRELEEGKIERGQFNIKTPISEIQGRASFYNEILQKRYNIDEFL